RPADAKLTEPAVASEAAVASKASDVQTTALPRTPLDGAPPKADGGHAPAASKKANAAGGTAEAQQSPELRQLLEFIDKLAQQSKAPGGANEQEMIQNFVRIQQERLKACEQALALKPDAATQKTLYQAMYEVHRI